MENEEIKQVVIHSINFETLTTILNKSNIVDLAITYQLPNLAKSWVDKPNELLQQLVDFYSGEDNWRLKKEKSLQLKVSPNELVNFGEHSLKDAELILAVPSMNSFFIIPGENSIKECRWNPAEVVQITNIICYMPMLLTLSDELDENEKFKLGASYRVIDNKKTAE